MTALAFPKPQPRVFAKKKAKHLERMLEHAARTEVRKRDGFKCRVPTCKNSGTQLHHIIFRSKSKMLRWETTNLIYLCSNCHALVHAGALRVKGTGLKPRFVTQSWMR